MLFIVNRGSLNKEWQADIKAVMNFRFYTNFEDLLTAGRAISFSLTALIYATVHKLSTNSLINRYRPNVEFNFNNAFCSKISQFHAQIKI